MVREQIESCKKIGWVLLVIAAMSAGCETATVDNQGAVTEADLQGINADTTADTTGTDGTNMWPAEITGPIQWLHTDVTDWPVTASLTASIGGGGVSFPYSKTSVWPRGRGSIANANVWVFVNLNGQWYAATWEYLAPGQVSKPRGVFTGSSIKVSPLVKWHPRSGERVGIMVSGLARTKGISSVKERSNVFMVTVP